MDFLPDINDDSMLGPAEINQIQVEQKPIEFDWDWCGSACILKCNYLCVNGGEIGRPAI